MSKPLKIAVLGAGHLGKIHLKLLKESGLFEVVGFYDPLDKNAREAEEKFGVTRWADLNELTDKVDAVDIVTPTLSHYDSAVSAIRKSKHVFIEKPVTNTPAEAQKLIALAEEADIKAQVGHVERFNPAFLALNGRSLDPMFIEGHRLATFNPRGTDVSVVLDLMIHDIDIVLSMVKANVRRISASGVAVVSSTPDIANARIEFDNGCVANLTASRISLKQMRKIRLFQANNYISIDMLDRKTEIVSLADQMPAEQPNALELELADGAKKFITFDQPDVGEVNAIKMELDLFHDCILNDTEPRVTLIDGHNALDVAHQILNKIEKNRLG